MLSNCGAVEESWESLGRQRRTNQSILKEISPEYSLEGFMLKLKLQSFDPLMRRAGSLEKTLVLGKIEGRRRGQQRMRWLDGITDSMDMRLSKFRRWWRTGKPGILQYKELQRVRHDWVTEQQRAAENTLWQNMIASKKSEQRRSVSISLSKCLAFSSI